MKKRLMFWHLAVVCLIVGLLGSAACGPLVRPTATPSSTPSPTDTATPLPTDTPSPTPTRGLAMPPESTMLEERIMDVNEDDVEEHIVTFEGVEGEGLAIDDWAFLIPEGERIERLAVRALTTIGPPRVLLFTAAGEDIWKYLYIWAWDGESYARQVPHQGPLDGEQTFRSAYYQPVIEDVDFTGSAEIAVTLSTDNPDYVRVVYYDWDATEKRYLHSTLFISVPKHVPMSTPLTD